MPDDNNQVTPQSQQTEKPVPVQQPGLSQQLSPDPDLSATITMGEDLQGSGTIKKGTDK